MLNQDSPVVLSDNSIDVDTSDGSNYHEIEHILNEENYSFLPKKLPKGKLRNKQKNISSKNIIYSIEQNISDNDSDDNSNDNDEDDNFIEEMSNKYEPSSMKFNALENVYSDDLEVPIPDFSEGFNWIVL